MHYYREQKVALAPSEWHGVIHCDNCELTMTAICDSKDEVINEVRKRWNTRYERTCTMTASKNALGDIGKKCSACERMNFPPNGKPYPYCPWCKAKVVDE